MTLPVVWKLHERILLTQSDSDVEDDASVSENEEEPRRILSNFLLCFWVHDQAGIQFPHISVIFHSHIFKLLGAIAKL